MPIFELQANRIVGLQTTTFQEKGVKERGDLQRLLRDRIDIIAPDTMVVSEEFGDWEDSKRRIDLLGLDRSANLIVFELKRAQDYQATELQAIRYAAMISSMTFEQVVSAHQAFLDKREIERDAQAAILEFLEWDQPYASRFAQSVRIVLVAEDFSKELTTSVMWLNERDLDIRCVRFQPYELDGRTLVDVQQTIPLPEAADYQIRIKRKEQQERVAQAGERDFTRYDITIGATGVHATNLPKRRAMYEIVNAIVEHGGSPENIEQLAPEFRNKWRSVPGEVDSAGFQAAAAQLAQSRGGAFVPRRWFCGDGELFHVKGHTYALSNQWGSGKQGFAQILDTLASAYPDLAIEFAEVD